jgi:hypothetical protein
MRSEHAEVNLRAKHSKVAAATRLIRLRAAFMAIPNTTP